MVIPRGLWGLAMGDRSLRALAPARFCQRSDDNSDIAEQTRKVV